VNQQTNQKFSCIKTEQGEKMFKRLAALLCAITLSLLAPISVSTGHAAVSKKDKSNGAIQLELDSAWDANCPQSTNLSESLGKVIVNQPSAKKKKKTLVTFILQDATPNTTYTVGFNIFVETCDDAPTTFGVNRTLCATGTVGCKTATAGVYVVGTLTTDAEGDGSLHVNLTNLPSGTHNLVFWAIPCAFPTNPSCNGVPQAATAAWGETDEFFGLTVQ
jgi:hypothetical protein